MKNICTRLLLPKIKTPIKTNRAMKLTCALLLTASMGVFATGNAQTMRVNIQADNVSTEKILSEIEKQTDYLFVYNKKEVDLKRKTSVNAVNKTTAEVLSTIFNGTDIIYAIEGENIMLMRKEQNLAVVPDAVQQDNKITGTVLDATGMPVIGANIMVKGTTNGTITDMDGKFSLEAPNNAVLQVSYVGYLSQVVTVGKESTLTIVLEQDSQLLDEVVAIGYGSMKKNDLTGAINHVEAKKLINERPTTVQDILRNAAPGLIVDPSSSSAKETPGFMIRGQRSLTGGTSPLIVLNGAIFNGDLSEINPIDIESVDVLKDASSAAIYGAKSANGVVIITTKKGKGGKPTVQFDGSIGFATMGVNRNVYDPKGFLEFRSDYAASSNGFENIGYYKKPTTENLKRYNLTEEQWRNYDAIGQSSTDLESIWIQRIGLGEVEQKNYFAGNTFDWYDASWQTGLRQNYNLSLSGQTDHVNYYWSLGYQDNEGNIVGDRFKNYRTNIRLDAKVTSFLEVGVNLFLQSRNEGFQSVDWGQQIRNSPYSTPYNDDGTLAARPMGDSHQVPSVNSFYNNSLSSLSRGTQTVTSNFFAKIKLPFNISYQFTFAPRYSYYQNRTWSSSESALDLTGGSASRESARSIVWTLDNIIKWNYTFAEKHLVDVTLLQSAEQYEYWDEIMNGTHFSPTDVLQWHYMQGATEKTIMSTDEKYTGDALMARLFYSYDNRYMITASVRRDGYSAFGRSNPRATFPAVALAWNFTNEDFWKWKPLSNGKLRFSWGQNGNRDIGIYQALAQLSASGSYSYATENGTLYQVASLVTSRMANNDLRWESTASWNVGLDFGFLNNCINGSFEWYYMPTTDLLMERSLPNISGYSSVVTNLGRVVNDGFEISLNTQNIESKDFSWSTTLGFSHNRNRIEHLYYTYESVLDAAGNIIGTKEVDDIARNWFIGKDISTIWDYELIGIWQEDEADEAAKYGQRPGDARARDVNGDYQITQEDKVFLGRKTPKFRWSLRNDFTYKDWTFSFNIYSQLGHKQATTEYLNYFDFTGDYYNTYERGYWTPDNKSNTYARLKSTLPSNVEPKKVLNKGFLRLENISIGYNVPRCITSKLKAQNIHLYGTIRNVAVWAFDKEWDYWDPETGGSIPRTFTLGASITF